MKKYKFDYIEEMVSKWVDDNIKSDEHAILGTPFLISLPYLMPNENGVGFVHYPAKDYYGNDILDIDEWIKQRNIYCKKLAKKNSKKTWKE